MPKRLGKFELPNRLIKNEDSATATYAKYTAEPFEKGFGHTIGNSLRRVLLSAIEGAAITSVKIEGVQHEFQSIEGIVEDVTDIVLNLKKVLLKSHKREPIRLSINAAGPCVVTAANIQSDSNVEVCNPEQVICTIDSNRKFQAEIEIMVGRGYMSADENKKPDQSIGNIPIDSLFSPVRRVNYAIEDTRVGMMTDYDKLNLEIWTDGRISPDEAFKEANAILSHHLSVFDQVSKDEIEFEKDSKGVNEEQNRLRKLLNMSVNEIELSVRAANCLNNANITKVGELAMKSEQEMLKYRNFGKKSLNEIKERLEVLGLTLGMKIDERLLEQSSEF